MAIQPDRKIIVAGFSTEQTPIDHDFAVARYEVTGRLDRSFGNGGKVLTDFSGTGSTDIASAVAIDSNGKIVVAGISNASGRSDNDFALARYNADGTLDTTFNSTGEVLTDFGTGGDDAASAVHRLERKDSRRRVLQRERDIRQRLRTGPL
jgi:uncharacterized delta-60 repeat protein